MAEFESNQKPARQGKPWTVPEEVVLKTLFESGKKLDEIVSNTERSPAGIFFKLKNMGLIPNDLQQEELPRYIDIKNQLSLSSPERIEKFKDRVLVLLWWQESHWLLESDQQGRFLNHPTLGKIIELLPEDVKFAISELRLRKLDEVFGYAYGQFYLKSKPHDNANQSFQTYRKLKAIAHEKVIQDYALMYGHNAFETKIAKGIKKKGGGAKFSSREYRGRSSLNKHGMVNPPPKSVPNLRHTSLYKCTICKKPVIGNSCACDGY